MSDAVHYTIPTLLRHMRERVSADDAKILADAAKRIDDLENGLVVALNEYGNAMLMGLDERVEIEANLRALLKAD